MADTTKFWELSGIFLSVVQMLISLERVRKYEEKLEEMADTLFKCEDDCPGESLAVKHRCRYREFRNLDAGFNAWYDTVPTYDVCDSGIRRGKAVVSQELGGSMRKLVRMNNGYTPLAMVGKVAQGSMGFVKATASIRAQNHNAEMKRKMEDQLLHWKMIVSIPVEQEGNYANFNPAIKTWQDSMANWGQGFNSGAAMFGTSLHGLLYSENQNKQNYGPIPTTSTGQQAITVGWPNNVTRRP